MPVWFSRKHLLRPTLIIAALLWPVLACADALVVSRAMFASTIAEYYVEQDHVRVELEIGSADAAAFRNLLPDALYTKMGFGSEPLSERIEQLFTEDLAIRVDGRPLAGRIVRMAPEARVQRDPVTGEPLPAQGEDPEIVIRATLLYPFEEPPRSLILSAPQRTGTAGIGFVLYHKGIAVNDFRYLSSGFNVELDWDDPWYSHFGLPSLRRQYFSPMTGFIYVEPYEVRKEIIVRPADIQRVYDLGLEGREVIPAELQDSVKQGIVEFLSGHFPVTIDGQAVEGTIDRVNFLQRTLRSSVVIDGQDVPVLPATVGVITVFPTDGLPDRVDMEWDLFNERMSRVPASTVDQAGPLPTILDPDSNMLTWQNFLQNPELPTLTDLRSPPTVMQQAARWGQWAFGALALAIAFWLLRTRNRGLRLLPVGMLLTSVGLTAWSATTWNAVKLDQERLQGLVGGLLHNVYRAFDYRGEEAVYDVLARSVSGNLLADVYLETRKGLELANQGGAQVKVKNVEMLSTELVRTEADQLEVDARWNVMGSVGHWGHIHQRTNNYHARLRIRDEAGAWKMTGLEILSEERL